MGTYQVNPGFFVSSVGTWKHAIGGTAGTPMTPTLAIEALIDADAIYARREGDATTAFSFYVRSAPNFLIDGVSTGRQSYPAGFWIHDVTCHYLFAVTEIPITLKLGTRDLVPNITSGGSPKTAIYTIDVVDLNFIHRVLNDGFGWSYGGSGGIGQLTRVDQIYLTGTWDYWSTQFTLDSDDYGPGKAVTIYDGDNTLGQFSSIYVSYIDSVTNLFVTTEATIVAGSLAANGSSVRITIPTTIPGNAGSITFSGELNGLTGLGEVIFGVVLLADASGIYTLVKDKTNDTLYDRSASGETIDTKIPNPFAKTAFLP